MSASAGRVLLIPKGDYNSGTTYNVLDWVRYDNKAYVCKQTSIGNLPTNTTYWQLLVQDGTSPTTKVSYFDNGILGAKSRVKITAETQTVEGITYTVADDGKVSVSGTASANGSSLTLGSATLPAGTYRKAGCPASGSASTYSLGGSNSGTDYGSGDTFTLASDTVVSMAIVIAANYAISGSLLFEPMICLDSDVDTTFRQYSMTNIELTEEVEDLNSDVTSIQSSISSINNDIADIKYSQKIRGPVYASSSYEVVFDNVPTNAQGSFLYTLCAKDTVATWKSYTTTTGTESGTLKITYTVNPTNVSVGSGNTAFYLMVERSM